MSTPSEILAAKIIERLIAEHLLTQKDGEKMVTKLAEGKLRAEDWRLPIELTAERPTNEEPVATPAPITEDTP